MAPGTATRASESIYQRLPGRARCQRSSGATGHRVQGLTAQPTDARLDRRVSLPEIEEGFPLWGSDSCTAEALEIGRVANHTHAMGVYNSAGSDRNPASPNPATGGQGPSRATHLYQVVTRHAGDDHGDLAGLP